jgi:CRISPR-associated exonuclease Cas4
MKLYQSSFKEFERYITPSEISDFIYCKRYIYYERFLGIQQFAQNRYKVKKGKEIHDKMESDNKSFTRKQIDSVKKLINVNLISKKYNLKGKIDEIHVTNDGYYIPLDYKYSKYDDFIYKTNKLQIVMYSLMIEETYNCKVKKGFLVFLRSNNKLVEVDINDKDKNETLGYLKEFGDISYGFYPEKSESDKKCSDCCYKNICVK